MARTGSSETRLIILRGNSASGKSSTAAEIRRRYRWRDLAIVGQDNLRRDVLREHLRRRSWLLARASREASPLV